jgi:hypothetical protein
MANTQRPELSSVFDDMLAQNKKRFDDLYRGGRPSAGRLAAGPQGPIGSRATTAPLPNAAASDRPDPGSAAAGRLNERFGSDWRYEIAEKKRDGDDRPLQAHFRQGRCGPDAIWKRQGLQGAGGRCEWRRAI